MEISGFALRQSPIGSVDHHVLFGHQGRRLRVRVRVPARASCGGGGGGGGGGREFSDKGHLKYYEEGREKEERKKREKLVKGLKKDLSMLYSMDLQVEEEQRKMISEAAELLLEQLKKMQTQEREMKKKKGKEEKSAMKANCSTKCLGEDDDSSSSSSSESSSDSDCEQQEIMQMSDLSSKSGAAVAIPSIPCSSEPPPFLLPVVTTQQETENPVVSSKIEVCMGGKCKKSGSLRLLEEFERMVGIDGAVAGCKCMGKCKEGPNVRVLNCNGEDKEMKNPLCIGVGLEDVGTIVGNFFGESNNNNNAGEFMPA